MSVQFRSVQLRLSVNAGIRASRGVNNVGGIAGDEMREAGRGVMRRWRVAKRRVGVDAIACCNTVLSPSDDLCIIRSPVQN